MNAWLRVFASLTMAICIKNSNAAIIPDFQVNPQDTAFIAQWTTDIAYQKNGNFVVVWEDRGKDHDNRQIYFQRYDSLGNPIGSDVLVSDTSTGHFNQICRVGTDSSGNFAICYSSAKFVGIDPTSGNNVFFWDIWVNLYSAIGNPLIPSLKVDTERPDTILNPGGYVEIYPHIARHKNGKFVVVWEEESNSEAIPRRIYAQFFDSNGQKVGSNIWVSNPDSSEFPISGNYSVFSRVAITDNGYVFICWEGLPSGQPGRPLARLYSLNGTTLTKVFAVLDLNDPDWAFGSKPDVDATPSNDFLVTFNSNDYTNSYPNNAIVVMRFDSLGNSLNRPVVVNDTLDLGDNFRMPRIDVGNEGYAVIWSDRRTLTDQNTEDRERNLMAQRFDSNDQLVGRNYRINGPFGSLQQNWQWYDLDFSLQDKVAFAWSDFRNFPTYHYDVYAKILDFSDIGAYVSGDLNQDGTANIADIIFLVNYVFKGGTKPFPLFVADVNEDCKVNLSDIIYLTNYVFKGGPTPKQGCA